MARQSPAEPQAGSWASVSPIVEWWWQHGEGPSMTLCRRTGLSPPCRNPARQTACSPGLQGGRESLGARGADGSAVTPAASSGASVRADGLAGDRSDADITRAMRAPLKGHDHTRFTGGDRATSPAQLRAHREREAWQGLGVVPSPHPANARTCRQPGAENPGATRGPGPRLQAHSWCPGLVAQHSLSDTFPPFPAPFQNRFL